MAETKGVQIARENAQVEDEFQFFQKCVAECLTIEQVDEAVAEWQKIRARVRQRQVC